MKVLAVLQIFTCKCDWLSETLTPAMISFSSTFHEWVLFLVTHLKHLCHGGSTVMTEGLSFMEEGTEARRLGHRGKMA